MALSGSYIPGLALDAAGLVALADLWAIKKRTALLGTIAARIVEIECLRDRKQAGFGGGYRGTMLWVVPECRRCDYDSR